jgi:hypothetical protein
MTSGELLKYRNGLVMLQTITPEAAKISSDKAVAPVRIDGADTGQTRLFDHSTRGAVDCHGRGDNPRKILARESHGDQRTSALGGQASTPGIATEPVAEFPHAVAHSPVRETSYKGARARLDGRPNVMFAAAWHQKSRAFLFEPRPVG